MSSHPNAKRTFTQLARAMELLGHGSMNELRELGFTTRAQTMDQALALLPPTFAIDPRCGFGTSEDAPLGDERLGEISREDPELVHDVIRVLFERGDVRGAGALLERVMGMVEVGDLVIAHCFELIDRGFVALVENHVFDAAFGASREVRDLVSAVLDLLRTPSELFGRALKRTLMTLRSLEDELADGRPARRDFELKAQAKALLALVLAWSTSTESPAKGNAATRASEEGGFLRRIRQIGAVHDLCIEGRYERAYELLRHTDHGAGDVSLLSSLLAAQYFLVLLLTGRSIHEYERRIFRRSLAFLDVHGFFVLSHSVEGYALAVLGFTGTYDAVEPVRDSLCRLVPHPDTRLRCALSVALAAMLVRRGSFFAAFSEVRDIERELRDVGSGDLSLTAYVVEALARELIGEEPIDLPAHGEGTRSDLVSLARLFHSVASDPTPWVKGRRKFVRDLFGSRLPSLASETLMRLAVDSPWKKSGIFRRLLPATWVVPSAEDARDASAGGDDIESLFPRQRANRLEQERSWLKDSLEDDPGLHAVSDAHALPLLRLTSPARGDGDEPSALPHLRLRLLGNFQVIVGDHVIEETAWRRKASRFLLELLAIVPSHSLSRAEICELIWPDRDFFLSRRSLYSVVSCARETLGCEKDGPSYLTLASGRIALNPTYVSVDVDEFENLCKDVLAHAGDRPWRLAVCRHLNSAYAGGLVVPAQDVRGDFAAKQRMLQALFVDVKVEASDLALKEGRSKEALQFAREAREEEPLREDAVAVYLRALAADGRGAELEGVYGSYSTRLKRELLMAPSTHIEALYRSLERWVEREGVREVAGVLDPRNGEILAESA